MWWIIITIRNLTIRMCVCTPIQQMSKINCGGTSFGVNEFYALTTMLSLYWREIAFTFLSAGHCYASEMMRQAFVVIHHVVHTVAIAAVWSPILNIINNRISWLAFFRIFMFVVVVILHHSHQINMVCSPRTQFHTMLNDKEENVNEIE